MKHKDQTIFFYFFLQKLRSSMNVRKGLFFCSNNSSSISVKEKDGKKGNTKWRFVVACAPLWQKERHFHPFLPKSGDSCWVERCYCWILCAKKIMCQKSCLLCSDNYKQWSSYRSWQKKKKLRTQIRKNNKNTMYYHDDSCLTDQDGIISEKNRYM